MGVIVHGGAADETGFTDDGTDIRLTTITDEVGIGTLTPDTQLEISKDSANAEATISAYHNTDATTPKLTLRKADGSEASPALVGDNAVLGTISFQGHDGSGFEQGAKIEARANGTPSDGTDMPTELSLWTTPEASATAVQRATILSDGNVGIGNVAPDTVLQVSSATASKRLAKFGGPEQTGYASIVIETDTLDASKMYLIAYGSGNAEDGNIALKNKVGDVFFAAGDVERMRILADGNVGIGTAIPATLLHLQDTTADDGPMIRLHGSGQNTIDYLLGGIEIYNADTSADGPTNVCNIKGFSSTSYGAGGYLTFGTHDDTEGGEGSEPVERLRITSKGHVTMPYQPCFQVQFQTNYDITAANGIIKSNDAGWTEITDVGSNVVNGKFTAPVAGTYYIRVQVVTSARAVSTGDGASAAIFKNGSALTTTEAAYYAPFQVVGQEGNSVISVVTTLAASDYLQAGALGYGATAISHYHTSMIGHLIG